MAFRNRWKWRGELHKLRFFSTTNAIEEKCSQRMCVIVTLTVALCEIQQGTTVLPPFQKRRISASSMCPQYTCATETIIE